MTREVWGMLIAGAIALVVGLVLARKHLRATSGAGKIIVFGPVFEAAALATFAAEHFLLTKDLAVIVPTWMPGGAVFWTYFVGVALLAAAVSFILRRSLAWSGSLLALLWVMIVVTVDLPRLPKHVHDRFFWTLTVRELAFAAGALVLASSTWRGPIATLMPKICRTFVGAVMVFYAVENLLFPHFALGVPLELKTPEWMPATPIAYLVGVTLFVAGVALQSRRTARMASAASGTVLLLLTAFFYVPIFVSHRNGPLAIEGVNYVFDTLLFAATALLVGTERA